MQSLFKLLFYLFYYYSFNAYTPPCGYVQSIGTDSIIFNLSNERKIKPHLFESGFRFLVQFSRDLYTFDFHLYELWECFENGKHLMYIKHKYKMELVDKNNTIKKQKQKQRRAIGTTSHRFIILYHNSKTKPKPNTSI